jgi:hypothetical protein
MLRDPVIKVCFDALFSPLSNGESDAYASKFINLPLTVLSYRIGNCATDSGPLFADSSSGGGVNSPQIFLDICVATS